jgi:hemolysin activation/secretion protein
MRYSRHTHFSLPTCLLAFVSVIAGFSFADDAQVIEQQTNQIIQQQNQQLENDRKQLEQQREWVTLPGAEPIPDSDSTTPSERCFQINSVEVVGVQSIKSKEIQAVKEAYAGQCLGLNEINSLLRSLTSLYMEKGYVTTRAYLPQQDLSTGTLKIEVIEGSIESFNVDPDSKIRVGNAFPGLENETLNLRDIEQGIEQLNRLSSNQVWMDLAPGSKAGFSQVDVHNNRQRFWQGNVRFDNSGSESTGEHQVRLNLSADHLLTLNDYSSITYQSDIESNSSGKKSESISGHFDVPYGYWLFAFDTNFYEYENRIDGEIESFDTSGESNQQTLTASRVLYRGQTGKTEWINSLTRKSNENYVEDAKLDTSSRNLAIGKVQLRHSESLPKNQILQGSIGYKFGLDMFGSPSKGGYDDAPDPEYRALVGDLTYQKSFKVFELPATFSSSFAWQHSDDVLFGSEQFGVGGLYSVRGFKTESISGRSGAYLRNEINWRHSLPSNRLNLHSISPTLSWDLGTVFNESDSAYNEEEVLQGLAVGLRIGGAHLSGDFTYAYALDRPVDFESDRNQFYFAITIKRLGIHQLWLLISD